MQTLMSDASLQYEMSQHSLNKRTQMLLNAFHVELAAKLRAAEIKYGYSDDWANPANLKSMKEQLHEHVLKGDPLDVVAFAMFLWFHEESTKPEKA